MKIILPLLFLFCCTQNSTSQTPDYFAQNPVWLLSRVHYAGFSCGVVVDPYAYYVDGDTTISGQNYSRIKESGTIQYEGGFQVCNSQIYSSVKGYLRQQGKNVYIRDTVNNQEELLISFDLNIGDTLRGKIADSLYQSFIVNEIDSVLIGSNYRLKFMIDTNTSQGINHVIEGIGYFMNENDSIGEFFFDKKLQQSVQRNLKCFSLNGITEWSATGVSSCNYFVSVEGRYQENTFSIYPNPTSESFYLRFDTQNNSGKVYIIDPQGRTLMHIKIEPNTIEQLVEINDYASGIYTIMCISEKTQFTRRLVKQ